MPARCLTEPRSAPQTLFISKTTSESRCRRTVYARHPKFITLDSITSRFMHGGTRSFLHNVLWPQQVSSEPGYAYVGRPVAHRSHALELTDNPLVLNRWYLSAVLVRWRSCRSFGPHCGHGAAVVGYNGKLLLHTFWALLEWTSTSN